ncbi:alpha carbonic anhydrase 7-like [Vigna umbellata]|uniref:alpha carbonic anhydrase 7-like n=1 Tax=Vigna umbellata TaxID=87088 RepID=UPI001F5F399C|nr:alpha carbonic anhydrase 7-like [Vigna umbellata]
MEKLATTVSICCLLLFLSLPVMSREVEDEREFSYEEESENGPSHWGDIHPEWSACNNGSMQSPIDLLNERVEIVSQLGRLQMNYQPSNATIRNRGHDIMLEWVSGAGYLQINETKYVLNQCHWHSPSEHTIDGKRFDLELHLVHETPSGQTTVIGILYKIGRSDSFLSSLTSHIKNISETTEEERVVGVVDPRQIKIFYKQYYRYMGSLTIPPCTENVSWTIVKEIRSVSKEQVRLLRAAVDDESESNARPLQLINNRLLQLYRQKYIKH